MSNGLTPEMMAIFNAKYGTPAPAAPEQNPNAPMITADDAPPAPVPVPGIYQNKGRPVPSPDPGAAQAAQTRDLARLEAAPPMAPGPVGGSSTAMPENPSPWAFADKAAGQKQVGYQGASSAGKATAPAAMLPTSGGGAARPAGYVPTTRESETTETQVSPEERARLDAASADEAKAQRLQESAQGDVDRGAASEADEQVKRAIEARISAQAAADSMAAHQQAALTEEKLKRDKAHAEYEALSAKGVDPDRLWDSKDMGGKVATGLALVLNGLMPHHQFFTNFYKDRDLDIAAQKDNLERKGKELEGVDSHYGLMVKAGMDANQAAASAKVLADKQLDDKMAARAATATTALSKINIAKMRAEHAEQTHKDVMEELKATAPVIHRKTAEKYVAAQSAGAGGDAENYKKYADEWLKGGQKIPLMPYGAWKQARGGVGAGAASGAAGTKLSQDDAKAIRAMEGAQEGIRKLQALRAAHGGGALWSPEDTQTAKAIAANVQENLVAAKGRMNSELFERTSTLIPDDPLATKVVGLVGSDPIGAGLKTAHDLIGKDAERVRKYPGGQPDKSDETTQGP